MDQERSRIQEDLRGLISGDVRCDDLFVELYASDASIYQVRPLGVVRPRNTADVVACVQFAAENDIPIHPRGAGTGLAGESLGPGLILDFSRYMRRILYSDTATVRVQAGVVLSMLNEHLRTSGRMFGPDPAMSHVTTMGSVVSIDAAGSHWLRYGSARRHVESLRVVLSSGDVVEVGRHRTDVADSDDSPLPQIVRRLASVLAEQSEVIAAAQPKSSVNRSGYALYDVLADGKLDLARLLCGSEGTLALVTEVTLATVPLPRHRGVVLLMFESLDSASRAVLEILPFKPSACDLMDRRHLSLARESDVRYELLIPNTAEAVLLVEQDGDSISQVQERLEQIVARVTRRKRLGGGMQLAGGMQIALDEEDVEFYWQLARKFVPTLYRLKGSTRPLPFVEDVAVPPESLPDFLVRLQNTLKKHHVTASLFGHAGHGQLHIRPFLDLSDSDDIRRMRLLADDLYREVFDVGGTISGEHGDGLSRTPYLAQQFGPLCDVFRQVKEIFDPQGIFNSNKIVPAEPTSLTENLRPVSYPLTTDAPTQADATTTTDPVKTVDLQLRWDPDEIAMAARNCNGCGVCRSQDASVRMCPIFRFSPKEESSPRAKANLVRSVLTGRLDVDMFGSDEFKQIADLCVHCHQCRLECPASVDIPKLMVEAKGAYVRSNGLRPSDWALAHIDLISSIAIRFRSLANWALANRQARWVMEKTIGIAQGRKLPRLARRSFLQRATRRRLHRTVRHRGAKVAYFVDTYANYFDPQLAEALVAVLEHNGVAVYVPPAQQHAAMPMIAVGALEQARRVAAQNVALLAEAVRQGYTILASEPSAVLCLTHEYLQLLDENDDGGDARLVAEATSEACHYLWQLHQQGTLQLDFRRQNVSLGYHTPCHMKAIEIGVPGENLLRLIPGVQVTRIEKGCSGMAGTFGLKRENYRSSLRAGWGLISALRDSPYQVGATECSTCKIQMEQGVSKPTIHPIKMLALAYGLMPEVGPLLTTPGEELVVT